jgi:hypothetical protein
LLLTVAFAPRRNLLLRLARIVMKTPYANFGGVQTLAGATLSTESTMSGFRSVQGNQSIGAIVSFLTLSGHASGHSSRSACDRAWRARNERRRNDLARVTELADQPIKTLSGWSRLVTERQRAMLGRKAANKLRHGRIARFDLPRKPHLAVRTPPASATARRDFETSMPTKTPR